MTPQKGKKFRSSEGAERVQRLEVTNPYAAGIDVHSAVHFVAVNPSDMPVGYMPEDPQLPAGVRKFGAFTCDLEALAAWLKDCHVKTIAMESTGVYWIARSRRRSCYKSHARRWRWCMACRRRCVIRG